VVPVAGIRPDQLVDTFTQSRSGGRRHDAIDIMAPAGTPVLAAVDGRVVKLFASEAGGITLYQFDPTERYVYYYAHLQGYAPDITEGRVLRRGEVLGYVGATGNANPAGPHLHFAIALLDADKRWHGGTPVNPYPLLSGRPVAAVVPPPAVAAAGGAPAQTPVKPGGSLPAR
jgi:murein DD-endopeptidase MepM/ murein hydrolase activator NlpD